jgi:hypothetical protein
VGLTARSRKRTKHRKKEEPDVWKRPLIVGPAREAWKRRLHLAAAVVITTFFLFQLYGFNLLYNEFKWEAVGRPAALDRHPEFADAPRAVQLMYKPDSFIYYNSMLSMRGDREFEHRYRYLRAGYTIMGVAVSRVLPMDPVEALPVVSFVLMGAVLFLTYLISGSVLAPALCYLWGNLWGEWGFLVLPDTAGVLFLLLALWFRFRRRFVLSLATFAVGLLMREIIVFALPLLLTDRRLDRRALVIAAIGIAAFVVLQLSQVQEIAARMSGTIGGRLAEPGKILADLVLVFQVAFGPFAYKLVLLILAYILCEGYVLPAVMVDAERRMRDLHLIAVLPLNLVMLFLFAEDFTARYILFSVPSVAVLSVSMIWSAGALFRAALQQEAAGAERTGKTTGKKGRGA